MSEMLDMVKICSIRGWATSGESVEIKIGNTKYEYEVPPDKLWSISATLRITEESGG